VPVASARIMGSRRRWCSRRSRAHGTRRGAELEIHETELPATIGARGDQLGPLRSRGRWEVVAAGREQQDGAEEEYSGLHEEPPHGGKVGSPRRQVPHLGVTARYDTAADRPPRIGAERD